MNGVSIALDANDICLKGCVIWWRKCIPASSRRIKTTKIPQQNHQGTDIKMLWWNWRFDGGIQFLPLQTTKDFLLSKYLQNGMHWRTWQNCGQISWWTLLVEYLSQDMWSDIHQKPAQPSIISCLFRGMKRLFHCRGHQIRLVSNINREEI